MLFRKDKLKSTSALCALVASFVVALPGLASAQTALPPVAVDVAPDAGGLDQPLNTGNLDRKAVQSKVPSVSETAQLLDGLPGVSFYTGGGFSSLPVLRGLNDDRINTLVDGVPVIAACPNHMNPVLSYVQPSNVASIQVMAGITPVSKGGDSIAGTINVQTASPVFATGDGIVAQGSLSTFYKSVDRGLVVSASGTVANDRFSLGYVGSENNARDYKDGDGDRIAASSYRGQNHAVKIAEKGDNNLFELEVGMQDVPFEGFPNQYMDMLGNQSRFANAHYQASLAWGELDVRAYWRSTMHFMNFVRDRDLSMAMPMNTKQAETGYVAKGEIPLSGGGTLRVGNEYHFDTLNDWWPGVAGSMMMGPDTFVNLNNATRNRVGTYVEWEGKQGQQWTTLLGLRNDTVVMNTGDVEDYSGSDTQSVAFNSLNHQKIDVNFDATALARYDADSTNTDEIGLAHKTRSPNFYERYAWNTSNATMVGWFGDANGYVGSVDLKPEEANIISTTAGWHDSANQDWNVKVTPYYNYIRNYIGVNYVSSNSSNTPNTNILQFANHDAMTYGADLSGAKTVVSNDQVGVVKLTGTSSFQRGFTVNNGNSLYHMMPLNMNVALNQKLGNWTNILEVKASAGKSEADPLRYEPYTPGYAVVNLRTAYEWRNLRLDAGIDNLLNQQYYSPLGGIDLADWDAKGMTGSPGLLASPGRSYNAGVTVKF